MSNILILAEQQDGKIKKTSFELAGKAAELAGKLGGQVNAVVIGSGVSNAGELGAYGVKKVLVVENAALEKYSTEGFTKALADVIADEKPSVVLGTASPLGRDLFPRLAARLGAGLAPDCTAFEIKDGKLVATRPIFAGKCFIDVTFNSPIQLATSRPNSFGVQETAAGTQAEVVKVAKDPGAIKAPMKELVKAASTKADLTEAGIIVSGGRAMKNADNFKILAELADVLGATVGASRAAVDSGYAPHSMQVGQTGKTVNPKLYIACGISGAIQHLAGMRTSKVVVAINTDPEAPIFKVATYGVVGDLFKVVPLLTQELKKALAA